MAARTIDPAIGASTWALGSQRWVVNIGNLTRNPIKDISQNRELIEKSEGKYNSDIIDINKWLECIYMEQNMTNIGSEAVMVYIIRYILACSRSGW